MIYFKDLALKDNDYNMPVTSKTIFWDNFGVVTTPKYRNRKPTEEIKGTKPVTEIVPEVTKPDAVSNISKSNSLHESPKPNPNSNCRSKVSKPGNKIDVIKSKNAVQHQVDSAYSLLGRPISSKSEPTFDVIQDRGDSIVSPEGISKNNAKRRPADKELLVPKQRILNGCIYIKNAGNVYKSAVEAKALNSYEKDVFKNFPYSRGSTLKKKLDQNVHQKKVLKSQTDEAGDYQLVIYLSGLVNGDSENKEQDVIDLEKKKNSCDKSNAVCDKSDKIANPDRSSPLKLQKAKKSETDTKSHCKEFSTYHMNTTNVAIDLSNDDSDTEYELDESGNIVTRRKTEENLVNISNDGRNSVKPSDSGQSSSRPKKSTMSTRSRVMSQASLYRYSDDYLSVNPKVPEEYMWETFEEIFKNYTSNHRHSCQLISRKVSTNWMKEAGVVNEIMTQKQADDAFRNVAGAKITMNVHEYKDFLINLSLRMKLPCDEIYRRMCWL